MKYDDKKHMKEVAINYYINGKTLVEISKMLGFSRKYVSDLIKDDERVKKYRNKKIVAVYKRKDNKGISISISTDFWQKIGISKDYTVDEKVEITVDENTKTIIIKKY